jgi:glycosyltransferase involved in cell wall biosynthesis
MVKEMLLNRFHKKPEKVCVVYNCVQPIEKYSIDRIKRERNSFGYDKQARIMSCIGRLTEQKNQLLLIESFSDLKRSGKMENLHLLILGDGPDKHILEKKILQENISHYVQLIDSSHSVESILNISEFCILPSNWEGFPLVILEAASLGKSYIATKVGGVEEFIDHNKTGMLVPPGNVDALSNAILYLYESPKVVERLGKSAKMKFKKQFSAEKIVQETLNVYTLNLQEHG